MVVLDNHGYAHCRNTHSDTSPLLCNPNECFITQGRFIYIGPKIIIGCIIKHSIKVIRVIHCGIVWIYITYK